MSESSRSLENRLSESNHTAKAIGSGATLGGDGFTGVVHGLSLPDILQMFHHSRRSLVVRVEAPEDPGEDASPTGAIHISNGELVHASCGELTGREALRALLDGRSGSVATADEEDCPRTLDAPFAALLLDVLRELDETARDTTGGLLSVCSEVSVSALAPTDGVDPSEAASSDAACSAAAPQADSATSEGTSSEGTSTDSTASGPLRRRPSDALEVAYADLYAKAGIPGEPPDEETSWPTSLTDPLMGLTMTPTPSGVWTATLATNPGAFLAQGTHPGLLPTLTPSGHLLTSTGRQGSSASTITPVTSAVTPVPSLTDAPAAPSGRLIPVMLGVVVALGIVLLGAGVYRIFATTAMEAPQAMEVMSDVANPAQEGPGANQKAVSKSEAPESQATDAPNEHPDRLGLQRTGKGDTAGREFTRVSIRTRPPGLELVDDKTGQSIGRSPTTLDLHDRSLPLVLRARLKGMYSRPLVIAAVSDGEQDGVAFDLRSWTSALSEQSTKEEQLSETTDPTAGAASPASRTKRRHRLRVARSTAMASGKERPRTVTKSATAPPTRKPAAPPAVGIVDDDPALGTVHDRHPSLDILD